MTDRFSGGEHFQLPHFCHICGKAKANEAFSGQGHRTHVCNSCKRLPKAERLHIEQLQIIGGFLEQSNISGKNILTLQSLCAADDEEVRELAALVLRVAQVKPGRRRRFKVLRQRQPELLRALHKAGLAAGGESDVELEDLWAGDIVEASDWWPSR